MLAPTFEVSCRLYKFGGRIFSLIHHDKPREEGAIDNLTIYLSDSYLEVAQFYILENKGREHIWDNEWRLTLDKDGNEIFCDLMLLYRQSNLVVHHVGESIFIRANASCQDVILS